MCVCGVCSGGDDNKKKLQQSGTASITDITSFIAWVTKRRALLQPNVSKQGLVVTAGT